MGRYCDPFEGCHSELIRFQVYLTSSFGAADFGYQNAGYFSNFITEIDIKTGDSLTETQLLHISPLPLDAPRLAEGSHLYKINGTYYLMTAEGGTSNEDHREMIYRSTGDVFGPYEANPNNPLVFNGHNLSNPVLATGHADLVETPKGWFAVLLGTRPQNPTNDSGANQLGRETFLTPVTWENGWPVFNGGKDITLEMPGLYDLPRPKTWIDDFDGAFADKGYYTLRTPFVTISSDLESSLTVALVLATKPSIHSTRAGGFRYAVTCAVLMCTHEPAHTLDVDIQLNRPGNSRRFLA